MTYFNLANGADKKVTLSYLSMANDTIKKFSTSPDKTKNSDALSVSVGANYHTLGICAERELNDFPA